MAEKQNIPCRWQVKLKVEPSLEQSEIIDKYNFEVNGNETFVNISFETPAFDALLPDRSHEFEYAEQTIKFRHIKTILELMLARMVYQCIVTPLSVESVGEPELINRDELSNAGLLKERRVASNFGYSRTIRDVGDTLSESTAFWKNGFKLKSKGHEKDVLRIMDWLQRAEAEQDSIKRFILSWIAFNGLYGLYAFTCGKSNSDDATKFELLIDDLLCHEALVIAKNYGHILNHLETYRISSSSKAATNYSAKLKNERRSVGNQVDILKTATRCIYGVRKQVFHEAPEPADIEERAKQCYKLLSVILLRALRNFVIV